MVVSDGPGKILTFYSYKGGTGRSMALANVAWILASKGNRVLVLDWDLEAPGLHRYFSPFLNDKDLTSSNGIIDFVIEFALKATERAQAKQAQADTKHAEGREWLKPYANILRYASSLQWEFPNKGSLDFVSAGRQGTSYSTRVNSFNWQNFYDLLGGGEFLEAAKEKMRGEYDYILIDSRTGVSDTSGICTVQMPDAIVICFTLNNQSIEGAAAVANSIYDQRKGSGLRIFPLPTRTDVAELEKLELRRDYARDMFNSLLDHLPEPERESYLGSVEIPYVPYYAYEETLATFRDRPGHSGGILMPIERLTGYMTNGEVTNLVVPDESKREDILSQFANETLLNYDLFLSCADEDQKWADMLARRLSREKARGHRLRVFLPSRDLRLGDNVTRRIQSAINRSRKIVAVVSPAWVESRGSEDPILMQMTVGELEKRLLPLYYREAEIPPLLRQLRFIDFRETADSSEGYEKLLAVLRDEPQSIESLVTFEAALSSSYFVSPSVVGFVPRLDREGRDLVKWLKEELATQENRPLVLWGSGGVGKTILAAEVARPLNATVKQRVIWINGEDLYNPSFKALLDAIAEKLDRTDIRGSLPYKIQEQVLVMLSSEPTLVVLDGFEAFPSNEQALIDDLFIRKPPCSLLITSRQRVGQARNVLITGLSSSETDEFIERWIKIKALPPELLAGMGDQIFNSTEGIPLALQLLLGNLGLSKDPRIALDMLTAGKGSAVERIFNRSFNSPEFGDDGRAALLALALFVPSASRPALAEVAGFGGEVARLDDAMQRLSALSLVKQTDDKARLSVADLTRQLALARLRAEADNEFRRRFAAFFWRYTDEHAYPSPENHAVLEAEKENILRAMDMAFEWEDWPQVVRLARSTALEGGWLVAQNHLEEATLRCEQGLLASGATGLTQEVVAFAQQAASIRLYRGEPNKAFEVYKRALDIVRKNGSSKDEAVILHLVGNLSNRLGDTEGARQIYLESLQLGEQSDPQVKVANLRRLGDIAYDQGRLDEAEQLFRESLDLIRQGEEQGAVSYYLSRLGEIALRLERWDLANKYFKESLAISRQFGLEADVAINLYYLGLIASYLDDSKTAQQLLTESLEITTRLDDLAGVSKILEELGNLHYNQSNWEEARRYFDESLGVKEKLGDQRGIALILNNSAIVAQIQGNLTEAQQLYNESLEINRRLGDERGIAITLSHLGEFELHQGEIDKARQFYTESLEIARKLKDQEWIGRNSLALGMIGLETGDHAQANELIHESLNILEKLNSPLAKMARGALERVPGAEQSVSNASLADDSSDLAV